MNQSAVGVEIEDPVTTQLLQEEIEADQNRLVESKLSEVQYQQNEYDSLLQGHDELVNLNESESQNIEVDKRSSDEEDAWEDSDDLEVCTKRVPMCSFSILLEFILLSCRMIPRHGLLTKCVNG